MEENTNICIYCGKEIRPGQRRYLSRQAGMKGYYHWDCFVDACHQANRIGSQVIETIAVSTGVYENSSNSDGSDD